MDSLMTAEATPDKAKEIETIRKVCQKGKVRKVKLTKIDVFLQSKTDELFLFASLLLAMTWLSEYLR